MKRIHGATVEVVRTGCGEDAFMAVCLVTGKEADAYGFVEPEPGAILEPGEGAAIERALTYLGDRSIAWSKEHFCPAIHVMEHDRKPTRKGKR